MKILIAGSTGLVGSHVLRVALGDPRVTSVVAPSRHALPAHPKLQSPIVSFDDLPAGANWWGVDAVICALGTTMKKAGTQKRSGA